MEVGLLDLYTNGHHLPYATRLKKALESASGWDVKFITLSEIQRITELFDPEDVIYLDEQDAPCIENRTRGFNQIAEEAVKEFFSTGVSDRFNVVHFLFADDILGPIYRHSSVDGPRLIGELNGVFFERKLASRRPYVHPLFLTMLRSPLGNLIDLVVPAHTNHEQQWRDLYLYRCLSRRTFDQLVVHSLEAEEYVTGLGPKENIALTNIPYPAPEGFGTDISQGTARERLGLPMEGRILLFFGSLREEKGAHELLDALREYEGPLFTMYIAGPPTDVSKKTIETVKDSSSLDIITELRYIDNPEIYFRAADAIILPYTREFGRECTSQTLEEASSSFLPVIVPDFGAVGRLTDEWSLGMTYEQGSKRALMSALRTFAQQGVPFSDEKMEEYNQVHSYQQAAEKLMRAYGSCQRDQN